MTNNRTIEGRAKACDRREHRATLRPRGRRCGVSANRDFFVRSVKNSILSWQIVIWQIALRQIATHPNVLF